MKSSANPHSSLALEITVMATTKSTKLPVELALLCRGLCLQLAVIVIIITLHHAGVDSKGYCSFPRFVWEPLEDGSRRRWLTETTYIQNSESWDSQKEYTTRETEMIVRHRYQASCKNRHTEDAPCYRKETLYRLVCIAEEKDDKYRVQMKGGDNSTLFSCLRFEKINDLAIQVYMADPKPINEDRLCYDESIKRSPWPWLAPTHNKWIRCPIIGGFDFRIYLNERKQMCHRIWRPSRLESECIYGEGVSFYFPDENCSPFYGKPLKESAHCWGYWEVDDYQFLLLSSSDNDPHFVLRLPRKMPDDGEIEGALYLSPVTPLQEEEMENYAPTVKYYNLKMKRSEPGVCYDESERCKDFAKQGKCINSALHKYANYCKRSCGLCDFVPSTRQECIFPLAFQGEWMLFEENAKETVTITPGEIFMSHLGNFICKSKHWAQDHFKLLSVFHNGCRPRYSCVHFQQDSEHSLRYRLSRSKLSDESFEMCEFMDDPTPLQDRIRSESMKALFAKAGIIWGSCGMGGEVRVNATFDNGDICFGSLSDWEVETCSSKSKLTLTLDSCDRRKKEEHVCVGYIPLQDSRSVLITQHRDIETNFACWDLFTKSHRLYPDSWQEAYVRVGAQCGQDAWDTISHLGDFSLHMKVFDGRVRQPCRKGEGQVIYELPTRSPTEVLPTTPSTELLLWTPKVTKVMKDRQQDFSSKPRERKSSSSAAKALQHYTLVSLLLCYLLPEIVR